MTEEAQQYDANGEEVRRPSTEVVEVRPASGGWLDRLRPNQTTDSFALVASSLIRTAELVYATPFVPRGLRTHGATFGAMLYGREIGLPPMTAVQSLHEINGKVGLSAEMMRGLIMAAGHQFRIVESTAERCKIRARRREDRDDPDAWAEFVYTFAEAVQAGDHLNKEGRPQGTNYQKRPADMLVARCTTRAGRVMFADVIHGLATAEELEDLARDVERATVSPVEPNTTRVGRSARPEPAAPEATRPPRRRAAVPAHNPAPDAREAPTGPNRAEDVVDAEVVDVPDAATAGDGVRTADDHRRAMDLYSAGGILPGGTTVATNRTDTPEEVRPAPDAGRAPAPKIPASMRAGLMGHFSRFGLADDREERLEVISELVGRKIETANDLTRAEGSDLLDRLGKVRDRAGLYALLPDRTEPADAAPAEDGTGDV